MSAPTATSGAASTIEAAVVALAPNPIAKSAMGLVLISVTPVAEIQSEPSPAQKRKLLKLPKLV